MNAFTAWQFVTKVALCGFWVFFSLQYSLLPVKVLKAFLLKARQGL